MGRRVYFSFDYQDVADFRANVVRNSSKFGRGFKRFTDASIWEEAKMKGVKAIKELIDNSLKGTSICCVLIGSRTSKRRWVRYEIMKSFQLKKGQLGVGINWIKGKNRLPKFLPGENPYEYLKVQLSSDGTKISMFESDGWSWKPYKDIKPFKNQNHLPLKYAGRSIKLSKLYKTYSYDWENGNKNLDQWIETATQNVNR